MVNAVREKLLRVNRELGFEDSGFLRHLGYCLFLPGGTVYSARKAARQSREFVRILEEKDDLEENHRRLLKVHQGLERLPLKVFYYSIAGALDVAKIWGIYEIGKNVFS